MTRDITYGVAEEKYAFGNDMRTAYGVVVYSNSPDGSSTVIATFNDLFSEKGILERFVEKCNRSDLSPMHIEEVIDDLLEAM